MYSHGRSASSSGRATITKAESAASSGLQRRSPPARAPASRAAINRSESRRGQSSRASSKSRRAPSTTSGPASMLPCTLTPRPIRAPAHPTVHGPVKLAGLLSNPSATTPYWRISPAATPSTASNPPRCILASAAAGLSPRARRRAISSRPAKLGIACAATAPRPGTRRARFSTPAMRDAPAAPTSRVSGSTATIDHVPCAGPTASSTAMLHAAGRQRRDRSFMRRRFSPRGFAELTIPARRSARRSPPRPHRLARLVPTCRGWRKRTAQVECSWSKMHGQITPARLRDGALGGAARRRSGFAGKWEAAAGS